jgi:hypothetical protein
MAHSLTDLVLDYKIETVFFAEGSQTRHVRTLGSSTRRQQLRVEEMWQRQRVLGQGAYGTVWLERCVEGRDKNAVRAVKEIKKDQTVAPSNLHRELEAIFKFSHEKVSLTGRGRAPCGTWLCRARLTGDARSTPTASCGPPAGSRASQASSFLWITLGTGTSSDAWPAPCRSLKHARLPFNW